MAYKTTLATQADQAARHYLEKGYTPYIDRWIGRRINRVTALFNAIYCHSHRDAARFMLALHHARALGRLPGLEGAQEARAPVAPTSGA